MHDKSVETNICPIEKALRRRQPKETDHENKIWTMH